VLPYRTFRSEASVNNKVKVKVKVTPKYSIGGRECKKRYSSTIFNLDARRALMVNVTPQQF
jgi:hypothetical protein